MSSPQQLVLLVDDEAPFQKYVSTNLRARGYDVRVASDGTEALKLLSEIVPDLIVLDINLPGPDGFQVLQAIRREMDVPVMMLSARGRESDKVRALNLGADDYLTKPFGMEEFLARVRAALRRAAPHAAPPVAPYRAEALEVDFASRRVRLEGHDVRLTPREYELLAYLARNAGRVLTHRQILEAVWGPEYGEEAEYVWAYIKRLRRKIEPDPARPGYLLTETGVGYRLREADPAEAARRLQEARDAPAP